MKNSVKLIFASALLLTAASCAKDVAPQVPVESPVRFDIGVDGTKAVLVNSETETAFTAEGFKVTAYEGTTKKMDNVVVTWSGDKWTYTGEYLWKKNTTMRFFGYYPQALAGSLTTTNTVISAFTYSPLDSETAAVKGQTDIMLATYNGQGDAGKAPLNFTHPLASIKFIIGTFDSSVTKIKSIAIGGFYTSATCTPTAGDAGFTYAWSGQSGTADDGALEQSGLDLTPTEDAAIGTPFLLIPGQDFSSKNLTVLLTVTIDEVDKTLLATINSGTLEQGKTTTCTINYSEGNALSFSCTLAKYTANNDDDIFQTGPDPMYWVDLGMVSQNGHKLYVAAYDVESIDANGNITFADTDGKTPLTTTKSGLNGRSEFTAPGDIPCRLMAGSEAKDCFLQMVDFTGNTATTVQNKNITWNSGTGTSLITGKSISFSLNNYLVSDNNVKYVTIGASSNTFNMNGSSSSRLRMVYEDTSITYEVKNAIVYGWFFDPANVIYELKDWSIDQKEWQLGLDYVHMDFSRFAPIIDYNGTSFVSQSIIDITSSTSWSYFDVYESGYFLAFSGTSTRTVQISYAIDKTLTLHIYGSRGIE